MNAKVCELLKKDKIIRLIIGAVIFSIGIVFSWPDEIKLALFLCSYLLIGGSVLWEAIRGILKGKIFNEYFLISVATIGAFIIGEYPEGIAVMLFYLVGEMLQDMAIGRSKKSIRALMEIRPDYANLLYDGGVKRVNPDSVGVGARIVVNPGERIPLDGIVKDGTAMVDTAALTGESIPRELVTGSDALSGFINSNGVLTIEVTKRFKDSTVSRILELVQNASRRKAPAEQFITKFARYYTPAVVFAALALAIIPPIIIPGAVFSDWIYRALVFLVISCPCALVISIPLGFFGGIGGASKRGILVKGSNYLEALNYVETVVFDKTGTLTQGVFKVVGIRSEGRYTDAELIEFAAYAEAHSGHPIAVSIRSIYPGIPDIGRIEQYEEIAGHGLKLKLDEKYILVGSGKFMTQQNIPCEENETTDTVIYIAVDQEYAGSIVISDVIKEDSVQAIRDLKALGVKRIVMFTGDTAAIGEKIGKQLGLDEVYAELLPADKVEKIESLRLDKVHHGKIAFVGDGMNDAPVLSRADIGVAMGALGSDAAIEAADIVIMTDEPSKIGIAIRIAKKTRHIVVQNIVLAFSMKAIFLTLGTMGYASMWGAVFADVGVALIAILNAMRVMNTRKF